MFCIDLHYCLIFPYFLRISLFNASFIIFNVRFMTSSYLDSLNLINPIFNSKTKFLTSSRSNLFLYFIFSYWFNFYLKILKFKLSFT